MSVLDAVLREEYVRVNRIIARIEQELGELPKGYISEKKINGKTYFYLQYKENGKVRSIYLKGDDIVMYRNLIAHRNDLREKLKALQADKKKLEKILD